MLNRVLRNGSSASGPASSVCWRCMLERQLIYQPFHHSSYNSSKSGKPDRNSKDSTPSKEPSEGKQKNKFIPPKKQELPLIQSTKPEHEAKSEPGQEKKKKFRRSTRNSKKTSPAQARRVLSATPVLPKIRSDMDPSKLRRRLVKIQHAAIAASRRSGPQRDTIASVMRGRDLKNRARDEFTTLQASLPASLEGTSERFAVGDLSVDVINQELGHVPKLAHGLQRALFNRGVLQFRDLHSRVYNFDPALELLPPVDKVDFKSLTQFTPPSKDQTLARIAKDAGKKFIGSTSSLTGMLKHMHFLLSAHRDLNFKMLSSLNRNVPTMSKITKSPDAVILRYQNGLYSVDADKQFDSPNVLSLMGRYLEKYFTADKQTFDKFKIGSKHALTPKDTEGDAYHYSTVDDFLMRSQLDAYDPRLPGTGIFDLKTRAVLPIRMDTSDFEWGMDYEIHQAEGHFWSFEREFADMARSTMIKYCLQARIGRMDGIFVAYHNIARIFGFQYISINEMDHTLHGQEDRCLGDQEFVASMHLLNKLMNQAVEKFPAQSLRIHVEAPEAKKNTLNFFAEPVTDEQINEIQTASKDEIADWEREILGLGDKSTKQDTEVDADDLLSDAADDTEKFRARARKIRDDRKERDAISSQEIGETWANGTTSPPASFWALDAVVASPRDVAAIADEVAGAPEASLVDQPAADDTMRTSPEVPTANAVSDFGGPPAATASMSSESSSKTTASTPDDKSKSKSKSKAKEKDETVCQPLIALTLSMSNNVNRKRVPRPEAFTSKQRWEIDYQITEIEDPKRAWKLYEETKKRRYNLVSADRFLKKQAGGVDFFREQLKDAALAGKDWRKQRDESDRVKEERDKGVWVWDSEEPVRRDEYRARS